MRTSTRDRSPRKTPLARAAPRAAVGDTAAAHDFFAGRYEKVAAETFDAPTTELCEEDVAFAVGALAFLGRVHDAQMCFDGWRLRSETRDIRTTFASRFFLGVAYARAGDFARARELLVASARERLKAPDPWAVAFAFQGLACHRYFTGKYRAAARHALRALRAAHVARFAYAQMLSTDLRGHALVQLGQLEAGLALLERAKSFSTRLGFGMNAYAIECSMVVYRAKLKVGPEALHDLEALLARRSHDSYSRRTLLTQAAVQYALRGRGSDAARALEQADRDALRMDARRAKVTSLLARLYVTRWARGPRACAELLDEAASILDDSDVAFRAELLAFEAFVARATRDEAKHRCALLQLSRLARRAEHYAARAALEQLEGERPRAFSEDELTPLLGAAIRRDEAALHRVIALGLLGLVPEILGLAPGRRVLLLPRESALIIEDFGDLWLRPSPPRWVPPLLRILSSGGASKEAIVAALWGLRIYRPERHDPLVRTTIHRLRAFLEPRGEWVIVTAKGYGLAVPVHVGGAIDAMDESDAGDPLGDPLLEEDALDESPPKSAPPMSPAEIDASPDRRVHEQLVRMGEASVRDLARAIGLSQSTVLRALRRLRRMKKVSRSGAARATRYQARARDQIDQP